MGKAGDQQSEPSKSSKAKTNPASLAQEPTVRTGESCILVRALDGDYEKSAGGWGVRG